MPGIQDSLDTLEKFGLQEGKYILAVGRFVPEKGFDDLVRSWEIVVGKAELQTDNWKLVIAGDADHEDKYSHKLKSRAGRNQSIILTGFQSGKPLEELYSHAGLFILPSHCEGLPIALLEAMSYGLSCIASDIPANREVGLTVDRFFKAGDIEALAAKINEFMEIGPMSEKERDAQMRLIREKYDWDKIAEVTLGVYKSLCIC